MIPSQTQPPGTFFCPSQKMSFPLPCLRFAKYHSTFKWNKNQSAWIESDQYLLARHSTRCESTTRTKILKDNFYWDVDSIGSETMPNASDIGTPWAHSLDDALYKACWNTPLPYRSSSLRAGFSRTSFKAFGAWGSTRRSHGLHGWGGVCNWLNKKLQIWINLKPNSWTASRFWPLGWCWTAPAPTAGPRVGSPLRRKPSLPSS